jgi:hypothetical protein
LKRQKNNKIRTVGVAQVVDSLPSKYEAFSSNPSNTKTKKERTIVTIFISGKLAFKKKIVFRDKKFHYIRPGTSGLRL